MTKSRQKLHIGRVAATALWILVSAAAEAQAQTTSTLPPPAFQTSPAKTEKIVEEHLYFYRVLVYEPSVEVEPGERPASFDNPEQAALTRIRAMHRGDFEAFLNSWDPASRTLMEKRARERGHDAEFWRQQWSGLFDGRRVELTQRIETGPYVLVAFRVLPAEDAAAGDDDEGTLLTTAFKRQDDGRWLATQELSLDPVFSYWMQPGFVIRKMARGVSGR